MSVIFKGRIIAGKLVVDAVPTAGSTNPVSSQGVKAALDAKQNTLTFDQTPTAGSQNPVTSGGVKSALTWHTGNSSTDKTASWISIPNTAEEAVIKIQVRTNISMNFHLTKPQLSTASTQYYDAGTSWSSGVISCRIAVLNFGVKLDALYVSSGTEDYALQIYYR